ncbi:probable serine/threonine-protein kinase cdc7 [Condylostylus longicornis]|uniref:probable serine/threonine-protein kinase cdc7 n=1 Tax=Condylostylus longicornis TaxID=2530218 RepID=UPI00244E1052|nr:probable serine/threonine-protein kinase cdc7 [Condylostylus longicornis]
MVMSIKNDVITTGTQGPTTTATKEYRSSYSNNCDNKKEITNSYITTNGTDIIPSSLPSSSSLPIIRNSPSIINDYNTKTTNVAGVIPTSRTDHTLLHSPSTDIIISNTATTNTLTNTVAKKNRSLCKNRSSSYNLKKTFSKNKNKYNETECNLIHKYQEEEYASKYNYYYYKKNVKKDNNPQITRIINSKETNSDIITEFSHQNNYKYKNSTFNKSTQTTTTATTATATTTSANRKLSLLQLPDQTINNRIPTAPPIESEKKSHLTSRSLQSPDLQRRIPSPRQTPQPTPPPPPPRKSSTRENFKFSTPHSNYHKPVLYNFCHQTGYFNNQGQNQNFANFFINNTTNCEIKTNTTSCNSDSHISENHIINSNTYYRYHPHKYNYDRPSSPPLSISNSNTKILLPTLLHQSSTISIANSKASSTTILSSSTPRRNIPTETKSNNKSESNNIITISSKRNKKIQEVPLSSSLYCHQKRQTENENIIRLQKKQQQKQIYFNKEKESLYYQEQPKEQQQKQEEYQEEQQNKTIEKNQLQPCHLIFYEEKIKGLYDDQYNYHQQQKYNHRKHQQLQQYYHQDYQNNKQQQQQQQDQTNQPNKTETKIFIVNEKFNEYNKEATLLPTTTITRRRNSLSTATAATTTTSPSSFVGTLPKKKTKSKIYGFMKDFLKKKFCNNTNSLNLNKEEGIYVELPNNIKVISSNFVNNNNNSSNNNNNNNNNTNNYTNKNKYDNRINRRFDVMQDVRLRFELQSSPSSNTNNGTAQTVTITQQQQQQQQTAAVAVAAAAAAVAAQQQQQQHNSLVHQLQLNHHASPNRLQNCRPIHLFQQQQQQNNHCNNANSDSSSGGDGDNAGQQSPQSPSSEEDNSPTEMNNCRRLGDKPPLVKRLTMGFLKSTEDSRPLVHIHSSPGTNCSPSRTASDGYVNEAICEPDKIISSKFGDSCRQSLTALPMLDSRHYHDSHSEFNFKKKYLRETSSANSSPKMYAPSTVVPLRIDTLSLAEQNELRGAPWFQAGIPREISLEVLSKQNPGAFLVRQSSTKPGCFALSLRCPPPAAKVAHYLILRTPRGYKIKGFTKEFSSLRALITHHSVMPELLPIPLSLPRPHHNLSSSRRHCDDFDTYDSLDDLRKQMSEI